MSGAMEKIRQEDSEAWVNRKLFMLEPQSNWRPDLSRGLSRFREKCLRGKRRNRWWGWTAAAAVAICFGLVAFPGWLSFVPWLTVSPHTRIVDIGKVWAATGTFRIGKQAPDFTLKDDAGRTIRLSTYKGRVVLLNFWATWCGGCKVEIPWLVQFERKYEKSGLTVIGVSMDDAGWTTVKKFMTKKDINYPVVIGNETMAKPYGLSAMPMTFLIDRQGRIAAMSVGIIDRSSCEAEIARLLEN